MDNKADMDRRYHEYIREEKKKHQELADHLQKKGVRSAKLSEYQSGLPVVALDTDEYHHSDAINIASEFARNRRAYISSSSYPATTYLRINY